MVVQPGGRPQVHHGALRLQKEGQKDSAQPRASMKTTELRRGPDLTLVWSLVTFLRCAKLYLIRILKNLITIKLQVVVTG